MQSSAKKATFQLGQDILRELDRAIQEGAAPSKNALVQRALALELKHWGQERRRRRWQEAVNDPLFQKDLEDTEESFQAADAETARKIR